MFTFEEITNPDHINEYGIIHRDDERYFKVMKNGKYLCIYVIIDRNNNVAEYYWVKKSFNGKVLTKEFFVNLFEYLFSFGYSKVYTCTRDSKIVSLLNKFKDFGIRQTSLPRWDDDQTKTWFLKEITNVR